MKEQSQTALLKIFNTIFLAGVLVINSLANALPIGGRTTGEISDGLPSLFTPSAMTFSIWGLIYLLLILFCGYQIITLFTGSTGIHDYIRSIGPWFVLSSIFNMAWIFAWHHRLFLLSWILILLLLCSLIVLYARLRRGDRYATASVRDKILVFIPFSIYLGWISVATIANTAILLIYYGWSGWGISEAVWTLLVLAAAVLLGILSLVRRGDIYYPLVLIWALTGIMVKRLSTDPVIHSVAIGAAAGILVLLGGILLRKKRDNSPAHPAP